MIDRWIKIEGYVRGVRETRNRSARDRRLWPRPDDKAVQYSLNLAENARVLAVGEKQSACGSRVTPPPPPPPRKGKLGLGFRGMGSELTWPGTSCARARTGQGGEIEMQQF